MRDRQLAIYFESNDIPRILDYDQQPEDGWVIGRGQRDITFNVLEVSRTHAVIRASVIGDEIFWEIKHLGKNATLFKNETLIKNEWRLLEPGTYCFATECVYITVDWHQTLEVEREIKEPQTKNLSQLDQAIASATPEKIEGWPDFAAVTLAVAIAVLQVVWRGPIEKPSPLLRVIWVGFLVAVAAVLAAVVIPALL